MRRKYKQKRTQKLKSAEKSTIAHSKSLKITKNLPTNGRKEQKRLETVLEEAGKELQIAEKGAKSAAESVESYGKKANYTQAEVYQLGNKLDETNKELEQARSEHRA